MGCWNGTDALTQLAIGAGDPCRLQILLPYKYSGDSLGGGYCYSTGLYDPFALPIKGKYDDYGCIYDIEEDLNTKFIVRWFEEQFKAGNIEFSDRAETMDKYEEIIPKDEKVSFNIHQILNWIERNYIGVREVNESLAHKMALYEADRKSAPDAYKHLSPKQFAKYAKYEGTELPKRTRKFSFMLVLEETYQAALKSIGNTEESFSSRDEEGKFALKKATWTAHTREQCDNYLKILNDTAEAQIKAEKSSGPEDTARNNLDLLILKMGMRDDLFRSSSLINEFMSETATAYAVEEIKKGNSESITKWIDLCGEYTLLKDFMELSRKGFAPQAGAGSQSDEYQHHQALAKAVLDICHKREIERARNDGESEGFGRGYDWGKKEAAEKAAKTKKKTPKKGKVKKTCD